MPSGHAIDAGASRVHRADCDGQDGVGLAYWAGAEDLWRADRPARLRG